MKERIGVYICHCGGNISDYVDVEQLSKVMKNDDGVVIAKNVMFACADSNQKEMINDIKDNNLDAIVVASCSPKLHLHTFRNVAERAGLNPFNYVQVNIREQCSWPHSDKPQDATVKAAGLIRAGIRRVSHSEALENITINATKATLVIGAGVAGMRAAIDLAKSGIDVYLIEKDHFVGGRVAATGDIFISDKKGEELVSGLYREIKSHNNITLFTGTTVEKVSGNIGDFTIDIVVKPKYIRKEADRLTVKKAMDECNIMVNDDFNLGLKKRKAIYKNYPDAVPDIPVIDIDSLSNSPEFLEKYKSCFDPAQKSDVLSLKVGAVLVATGYDNYMPKNEEFGYKLSDNVVTLPEFKRIMELNSGKLMHNGKQVKTVTFVYCVGNRQNKGENKYCSRVCCTSTIHTSLKLKEKFSDIVAVHLFRDIRTYGKQELLYEKSSKQGDIYIRYDEKEPPVVEVSGNKLKVKVKDHLTSKKELGIDTDMVVLVTGLVSRIDSADVAGKFKIPVGNDKFFNEIHPKLKPVETVIKGVYIGGCCQGPKNISESVQSSLSASSKINALIREGNISLDPIVAIINKDACTWCGKCTAVCEYDAINQIESDGKQKAEVNITKCKGCGICAPVCPPDAIEIAQYTNHEIEGMIDGFLTEIELRKEEYDIIDTEVEKDPVKLKEFPQIWKNIADAISTESKTIPQISEAIKEDRELVTYHLMTMNKYNVVVADGLNEKETYYLYKLKS